MQPVFLKHPLENSGANARGRLEFDARHRSVHCQRHEYGILSRSSEQFRETLAAAEAVASDFLVLRCLWYPAWFQPIRRHLGQEDVYEGGSWRTAATKCLVHPRKFYRSTKTPTRTRSKRNK